MPSCTIRDRIKELGTYFVMKSFQLIGALLCNDSFLDGQKDGIEIGQEHARFVVLFYFFSSFEHAKNLLIMGPNNNKNCSLKCDFLIFNYE